MNRQTVGAVHSSKSYISEGAIFYHYWHTYRAESYKYISELQLKRTVGKNFGWYVN